MGQLSDLLPKCKHGRPAREHCPRCLLEATPGPRVTSLASDVEELHVSLERPELNVPPLGRHVAAISRARGHWVVTCRACSEFRVRSADRHEIESAWGRHRGLA